MNERENLAHRLAETVLKEPYVSGKAKDIADRIIRLAPSPIPNPVRRDDHPNAVKGAKAVKTVAGNVRGRLLETLTPTTVMFDEQGRTIGGKHWDRRMRELRAAGWPVETVPTGTGSVGWRLTRNLNFREQNHLKNGTLLR